MKKIILLLIIILISGIIVISYFFFFGKESNILSKVPKDAKSVIIIDLKSLSKKLLIDKLKGDTEDISKFAKLMPDSLKNINWKQNGFNLLDKVIFFTVQNNDSINSNLIIPISNYKKFKQFIENLSANQFLNITKKNNSFYSKKYKFLVAWNKKFAVVSFFSKNTKNNIENLHNILFIEKAKSIAADSIFFKKQSEDYDVFFYSKPYKNYPKKYNQFVSSNIQSFISYINFTDGKLEINTELKEKKSSLLENMFNITKDEQALLNISDTCAFNMVFNINPNVVFKIIEQYSAIKIKKEKIPIIAAWNGTANIIVKGKKLIEDKFVSYEFDDDFNKIEIIKTVKNKIWNIQAIFGTNKSIIDSIFKKNKVYRSKNDTLLFKSSNFIVKNIGNAYLSFNKNLNRPIVNTKSKTDNIKININYKKILLLLDETGSKYDIEFFKKLNLDKIKFSVNKKEDIIINSSFYFTNESQNSFFSIIKYIALE